VPFERQAWSYRGHPGFRLTTEHYELFTTLQDELLIETLPELMETALAYFRQLVPAARRPDARMPVYLFATRNEWADFTRRFAGPRAEVFLQIINGGYSERGVTVIKYTAHQTTFPIMAHEAFHQYLHHYVSPWVPAWLNEGMAVVCEGQRWSGQRLRRFDPWHNPARANLLAEALLRHELFPLSELLATNAGRIIQLPSRQVGIYYAQLWAWVLFLREGQEGRYAARFADLLSRLDDLGPDGLDPPTAPADDESARKAASLGEALFRSFVSDDLETVEREYREFIRQRVIGP
jgi:hypothetical protein